MLSKVFNYKYPALGFWTNVFGGHIDIGKRITIFGSNAMRWTMQIRTKRWGVICITLPAIVRFGKHGYWYWYCSPNGTPWASTFYIGTGKDARKQKLLAPLRKHLLGHNFDSWNDERARRINSNLNDLL